MKKLFRLFFLSLTFSALLVSCGDKNEDPSKEDEVDPSNADAMTAALVVPGSDIEDGDMPNPTSGPGTPGLTMYDATVSYSAGGQVELPIEYIDNSGGGIDGIYFQIDGANQYFDVDLLGATGSGTIVLPITIPTNVQNGEFCITISIYSNNQVSESFETCITVTSALDCDVELESGGEGKTSTLHDMGDEPGIVQINYETYTVPDRIDVFYGGVWVAGTGSNPGPTGSVPPLANCSNPTNGYIGADGVFCFPYDPDNHGTLVEVVVSGCIRGGTEWKYEISCADPDDVCLLGQEGDPRFNLHFDGSVDFDFYVKDPSGETISYSNSMSASGGILDLDCICCPDGFENIYWPSGSAPSGTYEYWVDFFGDCNDASSSYTITVTSNGNVKDTKSGSLSTIGQESQHYTYTHN